MVHKHAAIVQEYKNNQMKQMRMTSQLSHTKQKLLACTYFISASKI